MNKKGAMKLDLLCSVISILINFLLNRFASKKFISLQVYNSRQNTL